VAFLHVGQFAAAKDHRHGHFVLVFEKLASVIDFKVDVVLPDLRSDANFLGPAMMYMGFVLVLALFLLVLVLAEIHDPADGRPLIGAYLDQVHALRTGGLERFFSFDDAKLFAFLIDDPNGCDADLFI
jgi:hypothetical protein